MLLLHGMFGDYLDWEPVIEPLAERFRVIAVDLPGFGDSDKPDTEYDSELFIGAIRALLQDLGIPKVTLVGNSFGGLLALLFVLECPEAIEAVILVGSGGLQAFDNTAVERANRVFTEKALLCLTPDIQRAMFAPVFVKNGEARERYLEKQNEKLKRADYAAYVRAISRTIRFVLNTSCEGRLAQIERRTLLLWGDEDTVMPPDIAERASQTMPNAELRLLAGCGHAPQLECPRSFIKEVTEFMKGQAAIVH
jgi:pimeloyl-ACP methyl ester carboxylesterase